MKPRFTTVALILLIGSLIGGCYKYRISDVQAQFEATGKYSVVVASLDQRQFIVDKTSPDTYVGMVRGFFGNPWNFTTMSGLPFSDDVSQAICNSLSRKGFTAKLVSVKFDLTEEKVRERLLSNKEDRALLVIIRKWESDTYANMNVGYDLILKVIAKDGTILATAQARDEVHVPSNIMAAPVYMSEKEVPNIFKKSIESLLNNPDIVKVLASN
ncbi:MAG: hypothetical protein HY895_21050 [Deltaproteobacteria bacterium]|nr:hypothetical protein [Deltaproteobacteria bacterium]